MTRNLNLVVTESVRWAEVAATVREQGGPCFESLDYRDTYRHAKRLGDKKSLLFSIALRSPGGTLTSQQADEVRDRIVVACKAKHTAELSPLKGGGRDQGPAVRGQGSEVSTRISNQWSRVTIGHNREHVQVPVSHGISRCIGNCLSGNNGLGTHAGPPP